MRIRSPVLLGSSLLLFLLAPGLGAQSVSGRVVGPDEKGVAGAFVRLLDAGGSPSVSVLADAGGRFLLHAPGEGRYRLRVERVGYRIATTGWLELAAGSTAEQEIPLVEEPVSIEGLEVTGEGGRCVVRPTDGHRTHRLWEEARKALAIADWAEQAGLFQFELAVYERDLDPGLRRVVREEHRSAVVAGKPPFSTASPEELVRRGFVAVGSDSTVYHAPDAHVLLSDAFLDGHCFGLRRSADAEHAGWIGLTFSPVRGRRLPEVRGVLWLDERTGDLRRLEFGYLNLPRRALEEHAGGRIDFEKLPSGAWIVRRWWIRMPLVGMDGPVSTVLGVRERGGAVARILDTLGRRAGSRSEGVVEGVVHDSASGGPLPGARVYLSGTQYSDSTGADGRFRLGELPDGSYQISFSHPALLEVGYIPPLREVAVRAGETVRLELGTPSPATLARVVCSRDPPPSDFRIQSDEGGATIRERRYAARPGGGVAGVVRDSAGAPLARAEVRLSWPESGRRPGELVDRRATVRTDPDGGYRYCGIPAGTVVSAEVAVGGRVSGRTRIHLPAERVVEQDLRFGAEPRPLTIPGGAADNQR